MKQKITGFHLDEFDDWVAELVLQQHRFDGYRAIQSVQDKAWGEGNGYPLVKPRNVGLNALVCSLRASQKAVIHVVTLFVKGVTIPCKARLVANRFLTRCIHQNYVVGVLECQHGQHVRHNPPFVNRPWVVTKQGRAQKLGEKLNCIKCDTQQPIDDWAVD